MKTLHQTAAGLIDALERAGLLIELNGDGFAVELVDDRAGEFLPVVNRYCPEIRAALISSLFEARAAIERARGRGHS